MSRSWQALVVLLAGWAPCGAATLVVDPGGSGDAVEIQSAVDAASDGDTVLVKRGEYVIREPLDLNRLHDPEDPSTPSLKNIILRSEEGAAVTIIRMDPSPLDPRRSSVLVASKGESRDSVVEGFTLQGGGGSQKGSSRQGGGVSCAMDSGLTLRDCVIQRNTADWGGGVSCSSFSHIELTHCVVTANVAGTGGAVYCGLQSVVTLTHCTIAGNVARRGGGLFLSDSSGSLTAGIVHDNAGGSLQVDELDVLRMDIRYSCVEGFPGGDDGNVEGDPLLCGWDSPEVWVNGTGSGVPDGSETRPYRDLPAALDSSLYNLTLTPGSPCLGTGPGGSDMGAETGVCDREPVPVRLVHVAAGDYHTGDATLGFRVSLAGAGAAETVLTGSVLGLRTGCRLLDVMVSGAAESGIVVSRGESPAILRTDIVDCGGKGVECFQSDPELTDCTVARCESTGVDCYDSGATLTGCRISSNGLDGVAVRGLCADVCRGAAPTLLGCTITSNVRRGLSASEGVEPVLSGCVLERNGVAGLFFGNEADGTVENSVILSNGGPGVSHSPAGRVTLLRCTISGNAGPGIDAFFGAPRILGSIVWGNGGGAIRTDDSPRLTVAYSCVESDGVWPGEGNIRLDPQFCGWGDDAEVWVDAESTGPGDGSADCPYHELETALEYSVALSATSPCRGAGEGGSDMGADVGSCERPGVSPRTVHLARGTYGLRDTTLAHSVSLLGAGESRTVIEGTVRGLRSGMALSDVTVTGGSAGGVIVGAGQSPEIIRCRITGNRTSNSGAGLHCLEGASPLLRECTISGNSTEWTGGGVQCDPGASPRLESCAISWNSARYAAALNCREDSAPVLLDCRIQGNVTRDDGAAVEIGWDASPVLEHCTVYGNAGDGIRCQWRSAPTLGSCIVWGNTGVALEVETGASPRVTHSCIEGDEPPPGEGNIREDPLFCGWGDRGEVFVDDSAPGGGDGSPGRPYRELSEALSYGLALTEGSPCLGSGEGGGDMGALEGTCMASGVSSRRVLLRPGAYRADGVSLAGRVLIEGSRASDVILEGPVSGLRSEGSLTGVTVSDGVDGGIIVNRGQSPRITLCRIRDNPGDGVLCGVGASPSLDRCEIESNGGRGVRCIEGGAPVIRECFIAWNLEGGMECALGSSPRLLSCNLIGNRASSGGALEIRGESRPLLIDCRILGNYALGNGGALVCGAGAEPCLINCELYGNLAGKAGGAVFSEDDGAPELLHCTLTANAGGGADCASGSPGGSFTNCIVQGNVPSTVCGSLAFCLTDESPRFVRPGVVDFDRFRAVEVGGVESEVPDFVVEPPDLGLRSGSPALDAGTADGAPDTDIEGRRRPCGTGVDIGAHEGGACGLLRRTVSTQLGPEPEVVVQDRDAVAFHGLLSPSEGLEEVSLRSLRFRNVGPGDISRLVTDVRIYEDNGDGAFTAEDRPLGSPGSFDPGSGSVSLGSLDEPLDPAAPLRFFLVLRLAGNAPAAALPLAGFRSAGRVAWPFIALGLLVLFGCAFRTGEMRARTPRRAPVVALCLMGLLLLLLPLAGGCGGGGGGGGGAATSTELRMELQSIEATSAVTQRALEPVGLPLRAWAFEG